MRLVLQEAEAAVLLLVVGRAVDDHLLQASYNTGKKSDLVRVDSIGFVFRVTMAVDLLG